MIHSCLVACCTLALVCAPTSGQTQRNVWFPDSNAASGGANTFPWSAPGIRYQCIFTAAQMGNKTCLVNDIWVAPQRSMLPKIRTAFYDDIEIRMGMTSASVVTSSWSSNNPNPTTVYRGPLRVTFEVNRWRGLGLPKPFTYQPSFTSANLCFEVIIWKASASSVNGIRALVGTGTRRAFRNIWTTNRLGPLTGASAAKIGLLCDNGNFVTIGDGCSSSQNTKLVISADTFPQTTKPITISLKGALPSSLAFLAVGLSDTKGVSASLPIDGGIFGAPGCFVWNDPLVLVGTATSNTGTVGLKFVVPSSTGNVRVYVHWWNFDKNANAVGVTTSNYAKILLGN